ncbi:hypothetical protein AURDEDRAFT_172462 [Auricularia subglabra TFB-10046 SS5]|nr:hypothetical protein AURDEDRAFT_172462 [Auricularia subglabra TFB-10046 SS5]
MPGNHLTVWLAHPRGMPFRRQRVLRIIDCTHEQHDDFDSDLLASQSYGELRELAWSAYRHCLPFLPHFLSLTPGLKRLHVHALRNAFTTLEEVVPERPSWPPLDQPYTFSLTSFECSAILTADIIFRFIECSSRTLRHLYLLIHASQFDVLVPELPELPALQSHVILPADEALQLPLVGRLLNLCPHLKMLGIPAEDPDDSRELQRYAHHSLGLNELTLYSAHRLWSARETQNLSATLHHWSRLRMLRLVTIGFDDDGVRETLHGICARKQIALMVTVCRPLTAACIDLQGNALVSYAGMPRF